MSEPVLTISQAVAVLNQTLDAVYPTITVVGEISQFNISKQRWVYADIKDESAKLRLFGTIYQLTMPLEDGMMVEVVAEPRIHAQYGFSLNIRTIRPVGEGSIKKAANLLQAKLEKEGLFSEERKRAVPYGPAKIGLIASEQSAAYADFLKIVRARWGAVEIRLYNVAVQGESAVEEIVQAVNHFNQSDGDVETLVLIRGGGSADDLQAYSTEQVTRVIAASRIPTVVGVGHETDVSLAELASDLRASTPSNAAELLFPDKKSYKEQLKLHESHLKRMILSELDSRRQAVVQSREDLTAKTMEHIKNKQRELTQSDTLLESVHPKATLKRGFALLQKDGVLVRSVTQLKRDDTIQISLKDGEVESVVERIIKA